MVAAIVGFIKFKLTLCGHENPTNTAKYVEDGGLDRNPWLVKRILHKAQQKCVNVQVYTFCIFQDKKYVKLTTGRKYQTIHVNTQT